MANHFTYRILTDVEKKNLAILEILRTSGPISRTDISKRLEINMVTISNYVKNYIKKSFVIETGQEVSTGGRRPELIDLNAAGGYAIGVGITPYSLIATIADLKLKVIERISKVEAFGVPKVVDVIRELIDDSKIDAKKIRGIGLGVSSIMKININELEDAVAEKFSLPTFVAQDAMCAAMAEKRLNPKADVYNMLYMHSDVGCGIILQGDIYLGSSGDAGEISLSSERLGDKEEVFLKESNYLKPWSSDLGIVSEARDMISKGVGTKMVQLVKGDISKVGLDTVIEAAKSDDEVAKGIISVAGTNLGLRIAYLVNLFNPEVVVIGGGIEQAGDIVLRSVEEVIRKFSLENSIRVLKVTPSILGEDSVSLGSASLMIRECFLKI
ncbi:MAG: ROK family protein [Candidatus Omnitrophota bacterium]